MGLLFSLDWPPSLTRLGACSPLSVAERRTHAAPIKVSAPNKQSHCVRSCPSWCLRELVVTFGRSSVGCGGNPTNRKRQKCLERRQQLETDNNGGKKEKGKILRVFESKFSARLRHSIQVS